MALELSDHEKNIIRAVAYLEDPARCTGPVLVSDVAELMAISRIGIGQFLLRLAIQKVVTINCFYTSNGIPCDYYVTMREAGWMIASQMPEWGEPYA